MIMNIRGTSGSGKSTIVKRVMDRFTSQIPIHIPKRRQPAGYELTGGAMESPPLFVVGHYESPCGGCDTLSFTGSQDTIWGWVREYHTKGYNVLFEGVIVGDDTRRTIQAHEDRLPLILIELTTPLDECLRGIQSRRDARGDARKLNPKNTAKRMSPIRNRMRKFKRMGMDVRNLDRGDALALCMETLCR